MERIQAVLQVNDNYKSILDGETFIVSKCNYEKGKNAWMMMKLS